MTDQIIKHLLINLRLRQNCYLIIDLVQEAFLPLFLTFYLEIKAGRKLQDKRLEQTSNQIIYSTIFKAAFAVGLSPLIFN